MLREIKFRVWDKRNKKWVEAGQSLLGYLIAWISDYKFEILGRGDYEIVQYTGLKDKNGVEIYEGDICKYRYGRWTYIGKVVFNTHACIFEMRRTEMVGSHGERAIKTQLLNHIDKVEVIGNIHDNPELLEV